jgi:UDP-N-acetylglucosamine--N-acetylmuramyl-(pentapeptide) pyrophosphoryl-undecaprenol N-acetylglucosamine transferase
MKRIVATGGGTGGHSIPCIEVLSALHTLEPSCEIAYLGTKSDLRSPWVTQLAKDWLKTGEIVSGKLYRRPTWRQIPALWNMIVGWFQVGMYVMRERPDAAFCKGGAASVALAWWCSRLGIPVVAHETDLRTGLANKLIARWATKVATAFPCDQYPDLPAMRMEYTGQPVRQLFFQTAQRVTDRPLIVVIGGSQGARWINDALADAWPELLKRYTIIQQCGGLIESFLERSKTLPAELRPHLTLVERIDDELAELMRSATLVVSRAGGSIFELAASRAHTLLVPLPTGVDAQMHQHANAEILERAGAAVVVDQREGKQALVARVIEMLHDGLRVNDGRREQIAQFATPHAARHIASLLIDTMR